MMNGKLSTAFHAACDLVYPRQCRICGDVHCCKRFPFICRSCFEGVTRIVPPYCDICAMPFQGSMENVIQCPNCSGLKLYFDRVRSVMRFQGNVRRVIHELKYSHQLYWSRVISAWLLDNMSLVWSSTDVDIAMPVPLHPIRHRERGFNQAWLLLSTLGKKLNIPAYQHGLIRVRETENQTHLNRDERVLNLKDAFRVHDPKLITGKRVLLVDDVLTTGSTASECSRVLFEAGAISVLVFTLARG